MHFAYLVSSHTSTCLFEDGIGGAVATTVASAKHQNLYAVAGALCFFCTKATSGIMRRRRLMCESRKERSDGIAIATKSIASSSLPVGLCRRQKGETREEGGHLLYGV